MMHKALGTHLARHPCHTLDLCFSARIASRTWGGGWSAEEWAAWNAQQQAWAAWNASSWANACPDAGSWGAPGAPGA